MPCRDYSQDDFGNERDPERDKLAGLLCTACQIIEEIGDDRNKVMFTKDLLKWWEDHKKADLENKERERDLAEFERLKKKLRK